MLAHPIGLDREALRLPVAGHGTSGDDALTERIERIRAAARSRQPAERHFSLQLFDLTRLKARLGWRWAEQRGRAIAMIEAGLAREMTPADLHLDNGDTRYFAVRVASERRDIERHAELLAADVTARLCGTIPGGAIIRVVTLTFDPDAKLAGIATVAALLARLEALGHGGELAAAAPRATPPTDLRARFRPVLQLRKRLVSAYRLTAQASDGQAGETLEGAFGEALDDWALLQAVGLLQGPRHSREPALIVPVHYPTLASMRSRDLYAQHCRQLSRRSSRQLIFELLDLPVELAQARTRELLGYLRPFCLALLVRTPKATSEIGHLASSGVRGISLAASTIRDDAPAVDTLTTLAGTARVAGMRSLLVDVSVPSHCRAADAAGIDHVSGDALMPPLTQPGRAFVVTRGG
jgi:hypothetical protein